MTDSLIEAAGRGVTRNDDLISAAVGERAFFGVEAQLGLTLALVGSMASEAFVRENRADFTAEVNPSAGRSLRARSKIGGRHGAKQCRQQ